jgi:biotin-[acetyl-CoA-carboxylase] ligase BirA-like protein
MKILELDTCKSTNLEAKRALEFKQLDYVCPDVIVARKQTQGKGRSGNWFSPEDCGIYMSVIRDTPKLPLTCLPLDLITQTIGLVIRDMLEQHFQLMVKLKPVNDIYLANKKLAGILCEYHPASDKLIVGIGLNTFKPSKVRKDLVNKITYLNDWAAEHLIIHHQLVVRIAEEILKI